MISCKKATELISKSMEEPLTLKEEAELKIHNFICEFCERFLTQSKLLRKLLSRDNEEELCGIAHDTKEKKEKLKEKLRNIKNLFF